MSSSRFEPSSIKNKIKREEVARKTKKAKGQQKLQKRLAQAKAEANDPAAKKVCELGSHRHLCVHCVLCRNGWLKMFPGPSTTLETLTLRSSPPTRLQ
jgi:hypothetical protein